MTELSTAPTTSPANSISDGTAPPHDAGQASAAPADASATTVLSTLEAAGWKALHHLETREKNATQIDHLAIGPGGIFVIDAHSWTPSTAGADEAAALNSAGQLVGLLRGLLPPLTRQYVVPILVYVDASPISMLRGSIQVCTTSMLPGVISSRRPVLNAGEIDDVVASLSSGLRASSRVAANGSSPSTAPTRRGFLRKGSRGATEPSPAPAAPSAAAVTSPAPVPVAEPPVVEAPVVEPVVAEVAVPAAEPTSAVTEPAQEAEYWPTVAETQPIIAPEAPAELDEAVADLAHPVVPADTTWDLAPEPQSQLEPPLVPASDASAQAEPVAVPDDEVADLAHPVVPTDTTWDLTVEPRLELEASDEPTPSAALQETYLPSVPTIDETPAVAEVTLPTAAADPIQPSLTASAVAGGAPTAEPPLPRPVGGRRKAPQPKGGVSRLLPTRTPRPGARARRSTATTVGADGDSAQEGDRDTAAYVDDLTDVIANEPDHTRFAEATDAATPADPRVEPATTFAQPEPVAADEPAPPPEPVPVVEPAAAAEPEPVPVVEPEPVATHEPEPYDPYKTARAVTSAFAAATPSYEAYDFSELEEPLEAPSTIRTAPSDDRDDEPPVEKPKKQKKVKAPRKPRLRRSKDIEPGEDGDVDLSQMPANLSERGRQMYVEMQRRPKADPTPAPTNVQTARPGRAGAVRKLFVFCVIGGAIGISSSHYDEINTWVSTHVEHLPGLSKIEGPPQPEQPKKAKDKKVKAKQEKNRGQGNQ